MELKYADGIDEVLQNAFQKYETVKDLITKADYKTAIELGNYALEVFLEYEKWKDLIELRCVMAKGYTELAQIKISKKYLDETLQIAKEQLKEDDSLIGDIYYQFGYLYGQVLKDSFTALPYFQKAFEIHKEKYEYLHMKTADNINNIGFCYWLKADFDNALKYMEEALGIYKKIEKGRWSKEATTATNNIGVCYIASGDVQRGLLFIKESLAVKLEYLASNHPSIAQSYNNIGSCYNKLNQAGKADGYFQKVLDIRLKQYGEIHPMVAMAYSQLGVNFHKRKDYKKCLDYNKKALEIQKKTVGEIHSQTGITLKTIANAYKDIGELETAIEYFKSALNVFLQSVGDKHNLTTRVYKDLATCSIKEKDYVIGFQYIQKALQSLFKNEDIGDDIHQPIPSVKSNSPLKLLKVLNVKGSILLRYFNNQSGEIQYLETAFSTYIAAQRIIRDLQKSYHTAYSKLLFLDDVLNIYEKSIQVALTLGREKTTEMAFAFASSEKAKASLLLASLQDNKAKMISNIPEEFLQKEKQLKIDLTYLEKNIQKEESKGEGKNEEVLRKWETDFFNYHQEYLQLLQELETDYPDYYQLKYDTKTVAPNELQEVLQENQVVISYFVGEQKLYIFVVTPDEFEVIDLQKTTDFDVLIKDFIEGLTEYQFVLFNEKGHQLHQLLIAPIQDFIVEAFGFEEEEEEELKQVFVIPHGVLNYLPFEALVEESLSPTANIENNWKDLDYLIKHCKISYHYSATLLYHHLLRKETEEEIPDSFGGFAPIYDGFSPAKPKPENVLDLKDSHILQQATKEMQVWATRSDAIRSDGTWRSLPHSEGEAKGIAKLFKNKGLKAEIFLREKASKGSFTEAAKRFKFLLVAAHGLVNDEKTALSGLVFYPNTVDGGRQTMGIKVACSKAGKIGSFFMKISS
ncbi:MAG: CHAT domain-containing protein, partial [Chitinophagales bacterium]